MLNLRITRNLPVEENGLFESIVEFNETFVTVQYEVIKDQ